MSLVALLFLVSTCMCYFSDSVLRFVFIVYLILLTLFLTLVAASSAVFVLQPHILNITITGKYNLTESGKGSVGNQTGMDCKFAYIPLASVLFSYVLIIPSFYWVIHACWNGVVKCLHKLVSYFQSLEYD